MTATRRRRQGSCGIPAAHYSRSAPVLTLPHIAPAHAPPPPHTHTQARTLAAWEETLLVDEAVERLIALDPLLLFEVGG